MNNCLMKVFITALFVFTVPTIISAASFNCAKAASKNEKAICDDTELSNLDEVLADSYKQARKNVTDRKKLKREQINWIKSLGTCDGNVACLITAYNSRLSILGLVNGSTIELSDKLQDRIAALNEREEILSMREQALTTELRAFDSERERFEQEKLALAKMKNSQSTVEQTNTQIQENARNNNCHLAVTSLGEQLSLTKCVAYTNQAVKALGQDPIYIGDYNHFWEVDKQCNYLPSLISQTKENHEEIGKASAASQLLQ